MRAMLLTFAAAAAVATASKAKSARDWKSVDLDKWERELEEGDDPELLRSEDAVDMELMERRKQLPPEAPADVKLVDDMEPYTHSQAAAGPAILVTTLEARDPSSRKLWTKEGLGDLATRWREMLFTAGIEVTCYDMEGALPPEDAKTGKKKSSKRAERQMVVTLQHGWRGYEVRDFLLKQPEVTAVEWDNVKTVPDRLAGGAAARGGRRATGSAGGGVGVGVDAGDGAGAPRPKAKKGKKGGRRRAAAAGGAAGGPEL